MSDKESTADIPAIFATIHHRSPRRPDGYTAEQIAELNRLANAPQDAAGDEGEASQSTADDDR